MSGAGIEMGKYILRRLLLVIPTLIGMSLLIFLIVHMLPGDIVDAISGSDAATTAEGKAALRHAYGLDEPLPAQYLRWMGNIARGDLGKSFIRSGRSAASPARWRF